MSLVSIIYATLETAKAPKDMFDIYGKLMADRMTEQTVSQEEIRDINDAISRKFNISMLAYIKRQGISRAQRQLVQ